MKTDNPQKVRLSFRVDAGVIEHNNRDFAAKNVDRERIKDNIIFKREDLQEKYKELFGKAVEEYNAKQKRADRKIKDYYEHIANGKQEKLFYEAIVEIGNKDNCGLGTKNWHVTKEMLDDYMREFEKRNPNIKVFNAVMHLDEATPHLHIDFVPICQSPNRGLSVRNSLKEALAQQGIKGESKSNTSWKIWSNIEKEFLDEFILRKNGFEWLRPKENAPHIAHKTVDEYKAYKDEINKLTARTAKLKEKSPTEFTQEETELIKNQNDLMKDKIEQQQKQIAALVRRYNSPFVKFEVFNSDKLLFIARELENQHIQFAEESNALYIPEYAFEQCKKIAAQFKNIAPSIKNKIKMDIDVLILSSDSLEQLLDKMQALGYEIKRGKYLAVKAPSAERFTRLKSLGEDYLPEKIEQRISEREKFPNAVRRKLESTTDIEHCFHLEISRTIYAVQGLSYRPTKSRANEPYCFDNDTLIENLSRQILTMVEFDIHSHEKLYATAENIQNEILEKQERVKQLSEEFPMLKEKIENGNASEELRRRYDLLPQYIRSIKSEIEQDKLKLSRVSDVIKNYERISNGGFVNSLIAQQAAEQERQQEEQNLLAQTRTGEEQKQNPKKNNPKIS